jgi:hypothetical protein
MSTPKETLWRIPFTPQDPVAQDLAQRVIYDLQRFKRHKFWDVECLQESLRTQSFSEILEQLSQDTHPHSTILHNALKEEFDRLNNWNIESEPQKFLVLWRDRSFCEGWLDVTQAVDNILFDARWASLQRVCTLQKDDSDLGFDPNRIGLITTPDGHYLLDIDQDLVTVWNPQNGEKISSWTPPNRICSAAPLLDDIIVFGLDNGSLYHWELGEDTQYEVHKLEHAIEGISAQEETCALFAQQSIHIIDAEGTQTHHIPFSTDDPPVLYLTPDGERLVSSNREKLIVWNLTENKEHFSLRAPEDVDEDIEQMSTAILDMCAHQRGIQLLDAVSLWELPLDKQFLLLQSLNEPMVLSKDCERMVSFEEGELKLLERREGRHYASIHNEELHNIWGLSTIISLTTDCSVLATAIPEGIIAWDFNEAKFSSLPLPFTFTTTLHSIPNSRLIAVDTGQSVSIFRFVSL